MTTTATSMTTSVAIVTVVTATVATFALVTGLATTFAGLQKQTKSHQRQLLENTCQSTYRIMIIGRPFVKRFALCLSCLSVCNVGALWPNGWMYHDETWHAGRPRPWPHCITWGPSSPSPKGHNHCTTWGPSSPRKKGTASTFHLIFGPCLLWRAGWMKTPLDTEVHLGPDHTVLDRVPAPPPCERGTAASPLFGPCLLWPRSPISATAELLFY